MLSRLGFPELGHHRRFVSALAIDAVGSGIWMPLSLLYFLRETSLTLVELGVAMTVANLVAIPVVPFVGHLVDALGAKRVLQTGNVVQAVAFALYPFVHTGVAVAALVFLATVGRTAFWGSYGPLLTQITRPGEREQWFGFLGAMRNAGFGVGGLLASVALTIASTTAYNAVVVANAASFVLAFVLMAGVAGGARPPTRSRTTHQHGWGVVLADRGYRWLIVVTFCYALTEMTLNVSMPVYFVDLLGLPGWVPGAVFVINTVMIGVGQGLVVRSMTGAIRSRVLLAATTFSAVSFVLLYAAHALSLTLAVGVVIIAAVIYTLGEMAAGPVVGALSAESAPAELRGRYMSVVQLAWNTSSAVAPLLFTWLLARGSLPMWGGGVVLCGVWAACVWPLHRRLPLASRRVTNTAETPTPAG